MNPQPAERDGKLVAGAVFFAVFAILALGGAYALWPPDFVGALSTPSGLTPAILVRAVLSLALVVGGIEFLCALAIIALSDR